MILSFKKFKKYQSNIRVKVGEKYLWPLFHDEHYMTANQSVIDSLPRSSKFFTFYLVRGTEEILIGCLGVLNQIAKKGKARRITRLVVLPEFQGLGLAKIMLNSISELYRKENITMYITTFHPRLGSFFDKSNSWEASANNMKEFKTNDVDHNPLKSSLRDGLAMFRYHYIGSKNYELIYNPLILEELQENIKDLDDNDKQYKNFKRKINQIERTKDPEWKDTVELPDSLKKEDESHIKSKQELKSLFKKPKRKVLSPAERKAKKLELKKKKEGIQEDEW